MSTFYDLPEVGREISLFTHYAQKEDSVSLYGFLRDAERHLFRDVQKVSGIGARIALAVLSGVSVDEFARLIQTGDVTALTRIPGIGKKTAERMVVELSDRAADFVTGGAATSLGPLRCCFCRIQFWSHCLLCTRARSSAASSSRSAFSAIAAQPLHSRSLPQIVAVFVLISVSHPRQFTWVLLVTTREAVPHHVLPIDVTHNLTVPHQPFEGSKDLGDGDQVLDVALLNQCVPDLPDAEVVVGVEAERNQAPKLSVVFLLPHVASGSS
jgi:Holliday junction DNA helicase RuvA subunit